jgi:hypothetical protein
MNFNTILIVVLILLIYNRANIATYYTRFQNYVTGTTFRGSDGIEYTVQNDLDDQQVALEYLIKVNENILILAKHIKNKYNKSIYDICPKKEAQVQNLLNRYNPEKLVENSPFIQGESSYTMNKGDLIALCIRDKKTLKIHDFNIIMFVFLHELAHVTTDVEQHEQPFWQTFKWLLGEAEECGIYKNVDFSKNPITYCGHYVDYSPYFDNSIKPVCV